MARLLGVLSRYSPEQMYAVVAAVDLYEDFVPWCQRSRVIRRYDDGSFDAELEIGFKFFVESYVSHVEMEKPKYIKTTASQSGLFDHLINVWEFKPGPVPGTCDLYFLVDFKFQSPLYRQNLWTCRSCAGKALRAWKINTNNPILKNLFMLKNKGFALLCRGSQNGKPKEKMEDLIDRLSLKKEEDDKFMLGEVQESIELAKWLALARVHTPRGDSMYKLWGQLKPQLF
uniref:Coenzyme Q-binding protein COQ10 START domain-containing protein n=1 Tax=Aegilops tauschii TaxID=37682 RepID=N1QT37_AEGTA